MNICKTDLEFLKLTLMRIDNVSSEQINDIICYLKGEMQFYNDSPAKKSDSFTPMEKPMKLWQVADFLGVSPRSVTNYVKQGLIDPVRAVGSNRAIGYTAASVRSFAAGLKAA